MKIFRSHALTKRIFAAVLILCLTAVSCTNDGGNPSDSADTSERTTPPDTATEPASETAVPDTEPPEAVTGSWTAGYGEREPKVDVTSGTYYVAGYKNNNPATGVLDAQRVKAFFISDSNGSSLLFITVDCVALSSVDVAAIRERLADFTAETGCKNIHVVSTHTHAGIDTFGLWGPLGVSGKNEAFNAAIIDAACDAAEDAYRTRNAGTLRYSTATSDGLQRDSRHPYVYDDNIYRLRFIPDTGEAGISLIDYAAHAESLRSENTLVSADYPRYLADRIAEKCGDRTVYVPGAIGGLIMTERQKNGSGSEYPVTENVVRTGHRIADAILAAGDGEPITGGLEHYSVSVTLPVDNVAFITLAGLGVMSTPISESGGAYELVTEMSLIRLGELTILTVPGELFPELAYGCDIAFTPSSPDTEDPATYSEILGRDIIVVGLCDDEIGYIVPPSDFCLDADNPYMSEGRDSLGREHYEETNSVGPQTAALLAQGVIRLAELAGLTR